MTISDRDMVGEKLLKPNVDIDELLQKRGVDANFLLYEAAKKNRVNLMKELVELRGADVNATVEAKLSLDVPSHNAPPLFGAVDGSAVQAVEWLLSAGADPNATCTFDDDSSYAPLWRASEIGHARIGKQLLNAGADVNAPKSPSGNTPLFIAVQMNAPLMISLLLSSGADPNKCKRPKTVYNLSPLQCAIGFGRPRLVAQLISAGAEITCDAEALLYRVRSTKNSVDPYRRSISDRELDQIRDLLTPRPLLRDNLMYEEALTAERAGDHRRALELLRPLKNLCPCTQVFFDIERVVEAIYGVKGSDCTVSVWDSVPLMTQVEPTHYQDYAWTQAGQKIYRHGGMDKGGEIEHREELWEFDIGARIWKQLEAKGKTPGRRARHSMFTWGGALYVWGGRNWDTNLLDTKLYRLKLKEKGALTWEVIKTKAPPPGRLVHAGLLYKGKFYITCGVGKKGAMKDYTLKDTWVLNLSNLKWTKLPDGPLARNFHGMWAWNDKLYVLGGRQMREGHDPDDVRPGFAAFTIERFVSLDLKSKSWADETVIGDRPFNISEFTVLPIYDGDGEDDPSSVLIWGGYSEKDILSGPDPVAYYGDEHKDFRYCYQSRLLRFYPSTGVWKKLQSTVNISPRAQSIAAILDQSENSLSLLICGGYGFTAETIDEGAYDSQGGSWMNPKASNEVFSVYTGNLGDGSFVQDMLEGKHWALEFSRCVGETMPGILVDFTPCSPTLHSQLDYTYEDYAEPPCKYVENDAEDTLMGVRVELLGLKKRSDLNGSIGRCGRWLGERYEIFIPAYEKGGPCTISVKPVNLKIAERLKPDSAKELMSSSNARSPYIFKQFPRIYLQGVFYHDHKDIRRHLFDQLVNPPADVAEQQMPVDDIYCGPVSRAGQVVMRNVALPEKLWSSIMARAPDDVKVMSTSYSTMLPCMLSSKTSGATQMYQKQLDLYATFVNRRRTNDSIRVRSFEAKMAKICESKVEKRCGKWLRLRLSLDGLEPALTRDLLVSPGVLMDSLHNQILCPAIGWKSYMHTYAFKRTGHKEIGDHEEALRIMDEEPWIGPKKSNAADSMFLPLFVGSCMADDHQISLGQLFAGWKRDEMTLTMVHDIGDWWSHTITVSKYEKSTEEKVSRRSRVANLIGGERGSIPEDINGLPHYYRLIAQLSGRMQIENTSHPGMEVTVSPCSELWWERFNYGYRSRTNRASFLTNPVDFDLQRARGLMDTEIRRPGQKSGYEGKNYPKVHPQSDLLYTSGNNIFERVPKKEDACAYCGVTVALKRCGGCGAVSYCSQQHAKKDWRRHKPECTRVDKLKRGRSRCAC